MAKQILSMQRPNDIIAGTKTAILFRERSGDSQAAAPGTAVLEKMDVIIPNFCLPTGMRSGGRT